jgi:hypothetical protein
MAGETQVPLGTQFDTFSVRLPVGKLRELENRARRLGTTRAELARRLLLTALEEFESGRGAGGALLDEIHSSFEQVNRVLTEEASLRAGDLRELRRILERSLIQQTEILMILRTVTYKDRPDDYELAMTKTRELLPSVLGVALSTGPTRNHPGKESK